jgi:hypothetical protein
MDQKQFTQLLSQLLDGQLTADELQLFTSEIAANDTARQELIQQLNLDEGIRLLHATGRDGETFTSAVETRLKAEGDRFEFCNRVLDLTDERTQRNFFRRLFVVTGLLASTAALVLLSVFFSNSRLLQNQRAVTLDGSVQSAGDSPIENKAPVDDGVAVVTQLVDVEYENALQFRVGDALKPGGRLRLRKGTMRMQFYRGAVVTLEGPAELEIQGVNDAVLCAGKAWAHVPEPAQGFTLHTPDIEVVDLGTDFGVEVVPGQRTAVSVFSGEVELYEPNVSRSEQAPISLTTGQGLAFGAGQREEIAVDRSHFIGDDDLRRQHQQQSQAALERWRNWSDAARQDPRVLMYYSFETSTADDLLPNEAAGTTEAAGHIIGCQWAEGRWPSKRALDFKRPSDRVRFQLDGEYEAVTLAAWVRIDGLDRPLCSLMLTDGFDSGEVHWQFNSKGELGLAIKDTSLNNYSRPLVDLTDLGKWIHVATTYDRQSGQVHQYFNGELIGSFTVTDTVAARFGAAELANWGKSLDDIDSPIRNFNGRMDEFVLYRAALTGEEIRAMYEAGKPN